MRRPICADDFGAIRARIVELRRQRTEPADDNTQSVTEPALYPDRGEPVGARKPGIPGWRVSRRKK